MRFVLLLISALGLFVGSDALAQNPVAFPAPVFRRSLGTHDFDKDFDGWQVEARGRLIHSAGTLELEAKEPDPAFYHLFDASCSQVRLRMKVKTRIDSECEIYWLTKEIPHRDASRMVKIKLAADDHWNDYEVTLPVNGHLSCVSLKIIGPPGSWWFDSFDFYATVPHPLTVRNASRKGSEILFSVYNSSQKTVDCFEESSEGAYAIAPKGTVDLLVPIRENGCIAQADLKLAVEGFPTVNYPVFLYRPQGNTPWIVKTLRENADSALRFELAPDASIARIVRVPREAQVRPAAPDEVLAILAPIVHRNGNLPKFTRTPRPNEPENELNFSSDELLLNLVLFPDEIALRIEPKSASENVTETAAVLEGPVVRVLGPLHGGLLCGVEFLGPGDVSSSPLDVKEPNNQRMLPASDWITIPLAAFASDAVALGLLWDEMTLQSVFSSPNSSDLSEDHRMSLRGERISAVIKILEPDTANFVAENASPVRWRHDPVTEMITWAVQKRGIPQPPPAPRTPEEQKELILAALEGPLQGADRLSWGYCVESDYPREPYADVLSSLYRLKGEMPRLSGIVPDGGVITDDAIYFLSGRALEWKDVRSEDIRNTLAEIEADGSVYRRSLFPELEPEEKTSFGYSARKAAFLFDYHHITGDAQVLEAGLRILNYLDGHSVPRGGYYWETTLHTPDLLSAAFACQAYLRAYEATKNVHYLERAKHFAACGLAFVYLWSDPEKPIQLYASVPMFGASLRENTRFGVAQPWAGIIYGYTLNRLAEHDRTLDWKTIARGLLHAAEQMQYPEGPYAGCVPDLFSLDSQVRHSLKLNPSALVSLRRAIEGETEHLVVLDDGMDRIAAPFPLQTRGRNVIVRDVPAGFRFDVLINGQRVESVTGSGSKQDRLRL